MISETLIKKDTLVDSITFSEPCPLLLTEQYHHRRKNFKRTLIMTAYDSVYPTRTDISLRV
jgi:hypothetical protein